VWELVDWDIAHRKSAEMESVVELSRITSQLKDGGANGWRLIKCHVALVTEFHAGGRLGPHGLAVIGTYLFEVGYTSVWKSLAEPSSQWLTPLMFTISSLRVHSICLRDAAQPATRWTILAGLTNAKS
jgi:hypothetical protein